MSIFSFSVYDCGSWLWVGLGKLVQPFFPILPVNASGKCVRFPVCFAVLLELTQRIRLRSYAVQLGISVQKETGRMLYVHP